MIGRRFYEPPLRAGTMLRDAWRRIAGHAWPTVGLLVVSGALLAALDAVADRYGWRLPAADRTLSDFIYRGLSALATGVIGASTLWVLLQRRDAALRIGDAFRCGALLTLAGVAFVAVGLLLQQSGTNRFPLLALSIVLYAVTIFICARLALWPVGLLLPGRMTVRLSNEMMQGQVGAYLSASLVLLLPLGALVVAAVAQRLVISSPPLWYSLTTALAAAALTVGQQAMGLAFYEALVGRVGSQAPTEP